MLYSVDKINAISVNAQMLALLTGKSSPSVHSNMFKAACLTVLLLTCRGVCIAFYSSHHYFILSDGSRPRPIGFWNAVACTWLSLPPLMVGTITNAVVDWFVVLRWAVAPRILPQLVLSTTVSMPPLASTMTVSPPCQRMQN